MHGDFLSSVIKFVTEKSVKILPKQLMRNPNEIA